MQDKILKTGSNQNTSESNERTAILLKTDLFFAIELKSEVVKFELFRPDDKNYFIIKNDSDYRKILNVLEQY